MTVVLAKNRRTLLTVYDLLHLFVLEGPKLRRSRVVEYLVRAGMGKRRSSAASHLRGFERLKVKLRSLGIAYRCESEQIELRTIPYLVIPDAKQHLARLSGALDRLGRSQEHDPAPGVATPVALEIEPAVQPSG